MKFKREKTKISALSLGKPSYQRQSIEKQIKINEKQGEKQIKVREEHGKQLVKCTDKKDSLTLLKQKEICN